MLFLYLSVDQNHYMKWLTAALDYLELPGRWIMIIFSYYITYIWQPTSYLWLLSRKIIAVSSLAFGFVILV